MGASCAFCSCSSGFAWKQVDGWLDSSIVIVESIFDYDPVADIK